MMRYGQFCTIAEAAEIVAACRRGNAFRQYPLQRYPPRCFADVTDTVPSASRNLSGLGSLSVA